MTQTFFFYDLETSGLDPRQDRIMQFAGQRTTLDLQPVSEPYNILVKLNDDTLPSPDALMVTGITPQQTQADGYTEAEFAQLLLDEVFTPDTITVGFNNIRFDDEFIRALFWRTFRDPYEWAWKDGRSRWDLLDVVRMTRALRPDGIEWPVVDGKATNRLELLTKMNGIDHFKAHDALSDVEALIAVTKLVQEKQPQLYEHLLSYRDKRKVMELVNLEDKRPFVYVSGRFEEQYHKATVAFPLTTGRNSAVVVYDLRYDPTPFLEMNTTALAAKLFASWDERKADDFQRLPVKELHYNKAPAVAPVGVLERDNGWERIQLSKEAIERHKAVLLSHPGFAENVRAAYESRPEFAKQKDTEARLYDGFLNDLDRVRVEAVRNADERTLADFHPEFSDDRLASLLLHYKARNYPKSLADDEVGAWETWRAQRIQKQLPGFTKRLQALARMHAQNDGKQFILQELQLWAESIIPFDAE